jgi:hypothetical protein
LADRIIVTGDSISMILEAASLGRPLAIYPLPRRESALDELGRRARYLLFRPRSASESLWNVLGLAAHRAGLLGFPRDLEAVHRELFAIGRAVPFGDPFPDEALGLPEELDVLSSRIRGIHAAHFTTPEMPMPGSERSRPYQAERDTVSVEGAPSDRLAVPVPIARIAAPIRPAIDRRLRMRAMYRHAFNTLNKKLRRELVVRGLFFLPDHRRRALERWVRGRDEYRTLFRCDVAVVSCGKSGRTWLRVLLSRFFQLRYAAPSGSLISFDNFNYVHPDIPRIAFTHDSYLRYCTGNFASKVEYNHLKVILLIRHPADVAVSQYFQWKHRILPRKKWLNEYPLHGEEISLFDFVMHERAGLPYVISFLNDWRRECLRGKEIEIIRYEDLHSDPHGSFERTLRYLGFEATGAELEECLSFGGFENMRRMEEQGTLLLSKGKMLRAKGRTKSQNGADADSFVIRRGEVGGWRRYFTEAETGAIERRIDEQLVV